MKILFSNPPWWESSQSGLRQGIRAGSRWPFTRPAFHAPDAFQFGGYLPFPFFLAHAASATARAFPSFFVSLRDSIARGESYQSYFEHVAGLCPDWIVIETATPSWPHDEGVLRELARVVPSARIILGGTLPCEQSAAIFAAHPNVCAIVQGEFDKQIAKVIAAGERRVYAHDLLTTDELNAAPHPAIDYVAEGRYWTPAPPAKPRRTCKSGPRADARSSAFSASGHR